MLVRLCPRCGKRQTWVEQVIFPTTRLDFKGYWRHGWRVTCNPEEQKRADGGANIKTKHTNINLKG